MISNYEFVKNSKKYGVSLEEHAEEAVIGFGTPIDVISENLKTALAMAERETIHDSLVPLVCEYIAEQPNRRNTRFRGHREQFLFFTRVQTSGEGRVYGAGVVPWVNFITGNSGGNSAATVFGAYSAGKLIGTSVNLYSEDSGDGNEMSNIVDVYKIQSDQYSKSYKFKENDKFNSHTKINLITDTDTRYILRGPWSLPLEPIGANAGISSPTYLFPTNNTILMTSKSVGRLGTFIVTNTNSAILIIKFHGLNVSGVESELYTLTLGGYSTNAHTSSGEISKITTTSDDFFVTTTRELDQAGEDLLVRVVSNNVNIMVEIHRVYEFEVGELFSNDITNDDCYRFYLEYGLMQSNIGDTGLYNGKASLGAFISTIVSSMAPHVIKRVKDTWDGYKYNHSDSLYSNIKRFFSKAIEPDQVKVGKAQTSLNLKTDTQLPIAKASTNVSTLNVFINSGKVKKPSKSLDENKYNTRYDYPILERTGMAPMMGSVKTQFDPGYIQVLTHSLPGGFQFFPVIVEDENKNSDVHIACMIKTHYGIAGVTYQTIELGKMGSIWFDERLVMTNEVVANIKRYLEIGPGSLKNNMFDVYITLDFDNTRYRGVEDESWMAAFTLLHNDAPDGLFTTGALIVDQVGQVIPKPMATDVMSQKLRAVKGLTIFTTGDSIFKLGSRPYEELNIHSLNCPPYVTSTWGLWMVSIKPDAEYKDKLFKNGVLRSYKTTSEVTKNFHNQFNLLVKGSNANGDKYGRILGGEFSLLTGRLAIPVFTLMGARDRVLNTYQAVDGFNVKKGYFDEKIDKNKLINWLSYGYAPNSTPNVVSPVSSVPTAVADVTPPSSITPNVFLNMDADAIIASLAAQIGTTTGQINVISSKSSRTGYNPTPIMKALADFRYTLKDTVTKPSDYLILLKIAIANVKNSLSKSLDHLPNILETAYDVDNSGFIMSNRFLLINSQRAAMTALMKIELPSLRVSNVSKPTFKAVEKPKELKTFTRPIQEEDAFREEEEVVTTTYQPTDRVNERNNGPPVFEF